MSSHSESQEVSVSDTCSGESTASQSSAPLQETPRGNPAWHFTVVTSAFTLGTVFSTFSLQTGGWLWGTAMLVYSYGTTWWSGVLIGRCVLHCSKKGIGCTYPEMVAAAFGAPGYYFTAVMQIMTYYLVCVSLLVNAGNWSLLVQEVLVVRGIVDVGSLCFWHYLLVCGCLAAALAQIQTFKRVLPWAVVSLLSTLVRQGLLYYQILSKDLMSECEPTFGSAVNGESVIISVATTAFLFGGHGLFPEEMREMRRPKSFFSALHASYIIIGVTYATYIFVAYSVWGDWVQADNQLNWPLNTATLVSALLSIVWGLIEMTMSHVMMLSLLESHLQALGMKFREAGFCPFRFCLRIGIVGSEVFLAFTFSSAGIGNLQGFVGAFGFTALTYYAPFAVYWKLVLRPSGASMLMQGLFGAVFLSGLLLTVAGVYASSDGVKDEIAKYRLFDTTRCSAVDFVRLDSCDNPCLSVYGFDESRCRFQP